MGWFYWIVSMALVVTGATVEAAIWMLIAAVEWGVRDIIAAIRKGAN